MGNRKVPFTGSTLKRKMLQALVDDEGNRYSIREAIRRHPELCIPISNWVYWSKNLEVINAEPFKGEPISEDLAWKYYESLGFNELSKDDFTNNTMKKKHMLDEHTLMNMNEREILGFSQPSGIYSLEMRKQALIIACGSEAYYNQVNEESKKKLLSR